MGFLSFLKTSDGKKQKLSPPTNPDSSLTAPESNNKGSALNMGDQIYQQNDMQNDITTSIPKPPLSDDYDMIHSDDPVDSVNSNDNLGNDQNAGFPQDDFGAPIQQDQQYQQYQQDKQNKQNKQNKKDLNFQNVQENQVQEDQQSHQLQQHIDQQEQEKEKLALKNDKDDVQLEQQKTTLEHGLAQESNKTADIDDELPDFDDHDLEEAKSLENSKQPTHVDLPVFEDAEELSEDEIHSYIEEGENKELYVSAESYQKTIDFLKELKRTAKKFDSGVRKVKESMNAEKEIFERFTSSLKLVQQNLLSMDNKFLKR